MKNMGKRARRVADGRPLAPGVRRGSPVGPPGHRGPVAIGGGVRRAPQGLHRFRCPYPARVSQRLRAARFSRGGLGRRKGGPMTGLDGNGLDDTDKPATEEGAQPKPTSDPDGDHLDTSQGQGAFDQEREEARDQEGQTGEAPSFPDAEPVAPETSGEVPDPAPLAVADHPEPAVSIASPTPAPKRVRTRTPARKAPSRAVAPRTAPVVSQSATGPVRPTTLAVDVGGTGLKASVLDAAGKLVADRVRVVTPHPCPPQVLIDALAGLVAPLPSFDRVSVGFPGVVRKGVVLTAPHLVTRSTAAGAPVVQKLLTAWTGFDLAAGLAARFGRPVRVDQRRRPSGPRRRERLRARVRRHPRDRRRHGPVPRREARPAPGAGPPSLPAGRDLRRAARRRRPATYRREEVAQAPGRGHRQLREAASTTTSSTSGAATRGCSMGHVDPSVTIVDNLAGILGGIKLWELAEH